MLSLSLMKDFIGINMTLRADKSIGHTKLVVQTPSVKCKDENDFFNQFKFYEFLTPIKI